MAANATVLVDETTLSWADRLYYRLESLMTLLGGIVIMLLMFLAVFNILGRWVFNLPVSGYIDWVEQAMAFMAFLGLSYTQRDGGHIRMDILIGQLKGRALWAMEILSASVMLVLSVLLTWGSYLHFERAFELGDTSLDIGLPTWPAKLVVPVAMGVLCLRLMLQIWGYSRALISGTETPVAVPLIEDAATAAAREAASVEGLLDEQQDAGNPSVNNETNKETNETGSNTKGEKS